MLEPQLISNFGDTQPRSAQNRSCALDQVLLNMLLCRMPGRALVCRLIIAPGHGIYYAQAAVLDNGSSPLIAMAGKGYDADWFVEDLYAAGVAEVVIPPRAGRKTQCAYDKDPYKGRNLVARAINKLKFFRRLARRFDKTARRRISKRPLILSTPPRFF